MKKAVIIAGKFWKNREVNLKVIPNYDFYEFSMKF